MEIFEVKLVQVFLLNAIFTMDSVQPMKHSWISFAAMQWIRYRTPRQTVRSDTFIMRLEMNPSAH